MQTLVIDYETFFSADYTLKKMPTLLYIRDPRFKVHGAGIKEDSRPAFWVTGSDLPRYFAQVPWKEVSTITHNSGFDDTIRFEKYGYQPKRRIDTLALCRALLCQDLDFDLDSICKLIGVGGKLDGGAALANTFGIRDLSPELEARLAEYAIVDAEREYELYELLYPHLPESEAELLDLFIRMSTEGSLEFDHTMAAECREEIVTERMQRLKASGLQVNSEGKVPQLSSREKFAQLLRDRGVEPPLKRNEKGEMIYAFSKKDPDFVALRDHPDVADLVEAKLVWSSNSAITRVDKLVAITALAPHTLPVQLNFSGAHTHRPSGGGGINMQNLNRGSKLRLAIRAPEGKLLIVVDLSQIELRVNMWYSGQIDIVELLTPGQYVWTETGVEWVGADLYKQAAAKAYKIAIEEVIKTQRDFHKVVQLGCGFGMGPPKFRATCAVGPMGAPPILISDEESYVTVYGYRRDHPYVKAHWDWQMHVGIPMLMSKGVKHEHGPITFEHEAVRLPSGLTIQYPNMHAEDGDIWWGMNGVNHKLYGGIRQENDVQALAQEIIKDKMLRIKHEFDDLAPIVHQVHDELIMMCPERDAMQVLRHTIDILSEPIWWAPDLPIRASGGIAREYSK